MPAVSSTPSPNLIHLPVVAETVRRESQTLPGAVFETRQTIREVERLVRALERHWLLRGYVESEVPIGRIEPGEVPDVSTGGQ